MNISWNIMKFDEQIMKFDEQLLFLTERVTTGFL